MASGGKVAKLGKSPQAAPSINYAVENVADLLVTGPSTQRRAFAVQISDIYNFTPSKDELNRIKEELKIRRAHKRKAENKQVYKPETESAFKISPRRLIVVVSLALQNILSKFDDSGLEAKEELQLEMQEMKITLSTERLRRKEMKEQVDDLFSVLESNVFEQICLKSVYFEIFTQRKIIVVNILNRLTDVKYKAVTTWDTDISFENEEKLLLFELEELIRLSDSKDPYIARLPIWNAMRCRCYFLENNHKQRFRCFEQVDKALFFQYRTKHQFYAPKMRFYLKKMFFIVDTTEFYDIFTFKEGKNIDFIGSQHPKLSETFSTFNNLMRACHFNSSGDKRDKCSIVILLSRIDVFKVWIVTKKTNSSDNNVSPAEITKNLEIFERSLDKIVEMFLKEVAISRPNGTLISIRARDYISGFYALSILDPDSVETIAKCELDLRMQLN